MSSRLPLRAPGVPPIGLAFASSFAASRLCVSSDTISSGAGRGRHLPEQIRDGSELLCNSPRPSRRTSRAAFTADPPEPDDPLLGFAPFIHPAPRRNSITPDRQRAFIATLAATGIVTQAARSIGASLEALYRLRNRPGAEGFSAAWDMAIDRGIARLEDCAVMLAIEGEELPIVSMGQVLGTYRKHNFGHIRFVLSQRRSARYGQGSARLPDPGDPAYARLRAQWLEEHLAEQASKAELGRKEDAAFLIKLNRQIERKRREAIASGAMQLLPDGRSEWTDRDQQDYVEMVDLDQPDGS